MDRHCTGPWRRDPALRNFLRLVDTYSVLHERDEFGKQLIRFYDTPPVELELSTKLKAISKCIAVALNLSLIHI